LQHQTGTPDPRPLDLDARGWVRSLQPGQVAATFLFWDLSRAPGQYPAGRYVVTYEGEGTLAYRGSAIRVDPTPGREVIDVDPSRGGGIRIDITATNPANYLRNISVRLSTSSTTDVFNPIFVERVAPYRVLRFKDWQATDGDWTVNGPSQQRRWSDRPVMRPGALRAGAGTGARPEPETRLRRASAFTRADRARSSASGQASFRGSASSASWDRFTRTPPSRGRRSPTATRRRTPTRWPWRPTSGSATPRARAG
jgi:hypothetical protein